MHYLQIKDQIREIVLSMGFEPIQRIMLRQYDFAVRYPKFVLNGFFEIFTLGGNLIEDWIKVQEEVK